MNRSIPKTFVVNTSDNVGPVVMMSSVRSCQCWYRGWLTDFLSSEKLRPKAISIPVQEVGEAGADTTSVGLYRNRIADAFTASTSHPTDNGLPSLARAKAKKSRCRECS